MAPNEPPDRARVKDDYFFWASDYYAAGRFAFWTKSFGTCGNFFHHAIELFLKGHLRLTMTPEELTEEFLHNLPRIWQRFKDTVADSRVEEKFDRTIGNVSEFEPLRYPDRTVEKGALFLFQVTREDLDSARRNSRVPGSPPRYLLALEEIDRLVFMLFDVCERDPKAFLRGHLPDPDRMKYLAKSNPEWKVMEQ